MQPELSPEKSIAKPCPMCAEPIQVAAVKCKHCGSDLRPTNKALENLRGIAVLALVIPLLGFLLLLVRAC